MLTPPTFRVTVQYLVESAIVVASYLVWFALILLVGRDSSGSEVLPWVLDVAVAALAAFAVSTRGNTEPTSIFAGKAGVWIWVLPALCLAGQWRNFFPGREAYPPAWGAYLGLPAAQEAGLYWILFTIPTLTAVIYSAARAAFRRTLRAKANRSMA